MLRFFDETGDMGGSFPFVLARDFVGQKFKHVLEESSIDLERGWCPWMGIAPTFWCLKTIPVEFFRCEKRFGVILLSHWILIMLGESSNMLWKRVMFESGRVDAIGWELRPGLLLKKCTSQAG